MAKVISLIERVADELIDQRYTRWTKANHLHNLNDAIAVILMSRPDLGRETKSQTVKKGQSRVDLPDDAYRLLNVNHANGYGLQFVDLYRLNQNYPLWRTMIDAQPTNWTRNDNDSLSFYLFPVPEQDVDIEYDYSRQIIIKVDSDPFPLPPIYEALVFDFMLFRAYSKDGRSEAEAAKATYHLNNFQNALAGKTNTDNAETQRIHSTERRI
ncbi:phage adaptor protein [Salinivibrio proteolyticus]|uniref:Phage tail protein n=1 Tax=Salinivibrio proteolyticus TaxID=334715 RepID=A0ABY7L9U8_9GAMM|nr:DUF6682 family protein [Salinivibrio proteolyticus]WBA13843.1 hypothetical protein N7E60_08875 [Salinivibrio proteolyticus]